MLGKKRYCRLVWNFATEENIHTSEAFFVRGISSTDWPDGGGLPWCLTQMFDAFNEVKAKTVILLWGRFGI